MAEKRHIQSVARSFTFLVAAPGRGWPRSARQGPQRLRWAPYCWPCASLTRLRL